MWSRARSRERARTKVRLYDLKVTAVVKTCLLANVIYICIDVCVWISIYEYAHVLIWLYTHTYTYNYTSIYIYTCLYIYLYTHTCVHKYIHREKERETVSLGKWDRSVGSLIRTQGNYNRRYR